MSCVMSGGGNHNAEAIICRGCSSTQKSQYQNWKVRTFLYSCNMHADALHRIDKALFPVDK